MAPDHGARFAPIFNAAWLLRHYESARTPTMRARRRAAIHALGLLLREAFNATEDFEPLLTVILDALAPREARRF